jgi:hypothetical protein
MHCFLIVIYCIRPPACPFQRMPRGRVWAVASQPPYLYYDSCGRLFLARTRDDAKHTFTLHKQIVFAFIHGGRGASATRIPVAVICNAMHTFISSVSCFIWQADASFKHFIAIHSFQSSSVPLSKMHCRIPASVTDAAVRVPEITFSQV